MPKYWEDPNRVEGGNPALIELKVTYVPRINTGGGVAALYVTGYWTNDDDEVIPLRRQPKITTEDIDACPDLLKPVLLFLNAPGVRSTIHGSKELSELIRDLTEGEE